MNPQFQALKTQVSFFDEAIQNPLSMVLSYQGSRHTCELKAGSVIVSPHEITVYFPESPFPREPGFFSGRFILKFLGGSPSYMFSRSEIPDVTKNDYCSVGASVSLVLSDQKDMKVNLSLSFS